MLIRKPISRLKPGESYLGLKKTASKKKKAVKCKTVKSKKHANKNHK
jgi:hypothetical protein